MAEAVAEEYRSSLCDLNFNSKPHINMLTMLAEENVKFAPVIVKTIVSHIEKVPPNLKLPSLYLVDSIMKNIGGQYITLFCDHMITLFSSVFEKVEETTRSSLYKLRQTWNDILPKKILYGIDCNVNHIDPAWPITAKVPLANVPPPKSPIHVNPKFLGTPTAQASSPPRNPNKPAVAEKNEVGTKDKEKEVMEIKKKQEEMLRLIEEKKEQLKALEQKKMEMAAKRKKKSLGILSPIPPPQITQKRSVNHRDPRLKKAIAVGPAVNDKLNPIPLQSVVVVPNVEMSSNDVSSNNGTPKLLQKSNLKHEKQNTVVNKAFHSDEISESLNRKNDHLQKKAFRGTDEKKLFEKPTKDIHNTSREHLSRTCKVSNKKHSVSPEEKHGPNSAKRFCKSPINKVKRPISHGDSLPHETEFFNKNEGHVIKKGKLEPAKSKNKQGASINSLSYGNAAASAANSDEKSGKMFSADKRLSETPILFGTKDKDYRQHGRSAVNTNSKQWHQPEVASHPSSRISQDGFYPIELKTAELPTSEPNGKFYPRDGTASHNSITRRVPDENYKATKMSDYDQNSMETDKFLHPEHGHMKKLTDPSIVKEKPDQNYNMTPTPIQNERLCPPPTKQFLLDGKNRNLYFVNEHAFVVTDDNEPRIVTFRGEPRNVHVEGLPQPIVMGFDGRTIEFDTEGNRNTIRFGAPSREVYINNFPHEVQFGGAPFTVLLEDKKQHRIKIDGPPPQVVVNKPSSELYEMFNRDSRMVKQKQPQMSAELNVAAKSLESSALLHDVDMRLKPSHIIKSSILPESRKDVDWRHVPLTDTPQIPWEVSKNSFETFKDYDSSGKGRSFSDVQGSTVVPNASAQWNDNSMIHRDRGAPERNMDLGGGSWPHASFRDVMPSSERPSFDPPLIQNQRAPLVPSKAWEMQPPPALPPPPSIPPSLNITPALSLPPAPPNLPSLTTLATLSNLPNLSVPPPSWKPLPPPPMFPGQVHDKMQNTLSSSLPSSNTTSIAPNIGSESSGPVVPTLPINVETIYDKLVAAGIITKKTAEEPRIATPENTANEDSQPEEIKDLETKEEICEPGDLFSSEYLKTFNPKAVFTLYEGTQCATCGMKFKETERYSRHLDWHFRMNRREKDGAKKANSRSWYLTAEEWIQYKEIEEAEERTPSYFDLQADGESAKNEEKEKIQSVLASECETEKCSVCGEKFQLFWVEEEEEWRLQNAVGHDGEAYHPMCYEDFKKAAEMANREPEVSEEEPVKEESEEKRQTEEMDSAADSEIPVKEEKDETPDVETKDPCPIELKVESITDEEIKVEDATESSTKDIKLTEENKTCIKEEIVENPSEENNTEESTCVSSPNVETPSESVEDSSIITEFSESKPMEVDAEVEEEIATKPEATVDKGGAFLSSDVDSDNFDDDFRPPTPDPRFQVLPPVFKGNELSALCTIM